MISSRHDRQLRESGIDTGVERERGYETVKSRSELLDFKKYQRRAPALRVPMFSPDGITRLSQIRPDNPRRRDGKAIKYETAGGEKVILDVHPRVRDEARAGSGGLWITEGIKKADALTSRGLCTVGLIGVWNWQRGGKMLPCWDHVRLDGRRVYIVFDSDVMVKEGVRLALERLVTALENRGAEVLVVYLPHAGDGKTGVDDYLVAGGTINELKMLARHFEPEHVERIRLSEDGKLRAAVEDLDRRRRAHVWRGMGGHSAADVYIELIRAAARSGKPHADGVRVSIAQRTLALRAAMSTRTVWKSLNRLQAAGLIYRDNAGRKRGESGAFVLRASVSHDGGSAGAREKATRELQEYDRSVLHLRAPRLRWSSPAHKPRRGLVPGTRRVRQSAPLKPRAAVKRLGKVRGHVLDALDAGGGSATLAQICEALHRKRPRDLVRRKRSPKGRDGLLVWLKDAGIITIEGDTVALTAGWLESLEEQRELGGGVEREELDRVRYRLQSEAFRTGGQRKQRETPPASLEAVRRARKRREQRLNEARKAEAAPVPPEVAAFVTFYMGQNARLRLELLCMIAADRGFRRRDVERAVKQAGYRVERLPEHENERFVFAERERVA